MFFSRNMSVCSSNTNLPLLLPDHSLSTWLLIAVKCPGITPQSQMQCVGDNTEHMAAAQSRRPGRKTRQVWGELGSGTEKRRSVDARVTAGLLAVQSMNGTALCPCRGSWETLRPGLYGNHTPAAVSQTLPLHLCENGFNQQGLTPHPFTSISPLHPSYKPDTLSGCYFTGRGVGNFSNGSHWHRLFSKSKNK